MYTNNSSDYPLMISLR